MIPRSGSLSKLLLPRHPLRFLLTGIVAIGLVAAAGLRAQSPGPAVSASPAAVAPPAPAASPAGSKPAAPAKEDLAAALKAAGNFKTFLKAAEAAGLTATLQKPGPYTVFAPTDTAFAKLPAGTLDDLLKPENKEKLKALVNYHLAAGRLTGADLAKADEVKTLEGTELDVEANADGKTIEVDEAKVLGSDIEAANGVIHAIDGVLQP